MLVLSRKRNESIQIGHDITVQIIEIMGNKVRLGIKAPDDVLIAREEIAGPMFRAAAVNRAEVEANRT